MKLMQRLTKFWVHTHGQPEINSKCPFFKLDFCYISLVEASIEEGEIVRESKAHHVIKHTAHVMCSVLSRLHAAAYTPNLVPKGAKVGVAGGRDMELPMGLQEGVTEWCRKMLALLQQPEDKRDKEW